MSTTLRRIRRVFVTLAVVVVLAAGLVGLGAFRAPFIYARIVDNQTLALGTTTGPMTWMGITGVTETSTSVTISVSRITAPLPGFGDEAIELTVHLGQPIGTRSVIDASSGTTVPLTKCGFPSYRAPGCT
jgi:hypothetical protein